MDIQFGLYLATFLTGGIFGVLFTAVWYTKRLDKKYNVVDGNLMRKK